MKSLIDDVDRASTLVEKPSKLSPSPEIMSVPHIIEPQSLADLHTIEPNTLAKSSDFVTHFHLSDHLNNENSSLTEDLLIADQNSLYSVRSKRSCSTSNDPLYDRTRIKPKLAVEECDVCDGLAGRFLENDLLNPKKELNTLDLRAKDQSTPITNGFLSFNWLNELDNSNKPKSSNGGVKSEEHKHALEKFNDQNTSNLKNANVEVSFEGLEGSPNFSNLSPLDPNSSHYKELSNIQIITQGLDMNIKIIELKKIKEVFNWYFNTPLPQTTDMFPWLHGLHKDNFAQKQFFLYQQNLINDSNLFNPFKLSKPSNIRFLMCINLAEDKKADISNYAIFHNANPKYTPPINLKNTVKVSETLQKIDVSKAETRSIIREMIDDLFNIEDEKVIDMLTNDCISINYLPKFLDLDPDRGVSLRNFHIQTSKLSTCSDFILYNVNRNRHSSSFIRILWLAQQYEAFKEGLPTSDYNVFVVKQVEEFEDQDLWKNSIQIREKIEVTRMSSATKLNQNVWIGNLWDYQAMYNNLMGGANLYDFTTDRRYKYYDPKKSIFNETEVHGNLSEYLPKPKANWKLFIHCHGEANFPSLNLLSHLLFSYTISPHHDEVDNVHEHHVIEFPPSGSIGLGDCRKEMLMSIINTCKLVYLYSSSSVKDFKVLSALIYCFDGYTELSLFVLCYIMYSCNVKLSEAMLKLHLEFGRPFYIFNSDVVILEKLEKLLTKFSPKNKKVNWSELETITDAEINEVLLGKSTSNSYKLGYIQPEELDEEEVTDELAFGKENWVSNVEGSLPSQILPYIYLGSLVHANCLPLLNELGIKSIISVGELLDWLNGSKFKMYNKLTKENKDNIEFIHIENQSERYECSIETVVKVNNLQDDGIDELSKSLPQILKFIDDEYKRTGGETKILIHCRVGVSRSATVVIAEVMRRFNVRIPDAYLYVRARRLNIIIQPNLRFMYELFKWDELQREGKEGNLREIDWFIMCREIVRLNLPYLNN